VSQTPSITPGLSTRRIVATWWPLAASWLLMALELPAMSAVIARLPDPEIHLAAYGGVVFPLALIFESPIIMLLAAATALSKDLASYLKLRRFMLISGALLTGLHLLVALTPLYYPIVVGLIPVAIGGLLMLINPSYVQTFFDTQMGVAMLLVAAGMEITGFLIIKKIVTIKY